MKQFFAYCSLIIVLLICVTAVSSLSSCSGADQKDTVKKSEDDPTEATVQTASIQQETSETEKPSEVVIDANARDLVKTIVSDSQSDRISNSAPGVDSAYVTESGRLYIVLSDNSVIDSGTVRDIDMNSDDSGSSYTVDFYDFDGSLICSRKVGEGAMAVAPENPVREGYTFTGWDTPFADVRSDLKVTAMYRQATAVPMISVKDAVAFTESDRVEVTIGLTNNPGILGMTLRLGYDDSVFTLADAENGDALRMLSFTKPGRFESPCNFIWDGIELSNSDIYDGNILKLTFDINDGISSGVYPISLSCDEGDIIGNDLKPLDIGINPGSIIIVK